MKLADHSEESWLVYCDWLIDNAREIEADWIAESLEIDSAWSPEYSYLGLGGDAAVGDAGGFVGGVGGFVGGGGVGVEADVGFAGVGGGFVVGGGVGGFVGGGFVVAGGGAR